MWGCFSGCQSLSPRLPPQAAQHPLSVKISARWGWRQKSYLAFYVIRDCAASLSYETSWEKSRKEKSYGKPPTFLNCLFQSFMNVFFFIVRDGSQMSSCISEKSERPTLPTTFPPCVLAENFSYFRGLSDWCYRESLMINSNRGGHLWCVTPLTGPSSSYV